MSNSTEASGVDEIEQLLDNHAALYADTTMRFITGEITEDERDKEWHHSDLKTKHALQRLMAKEQLESLKQLYAKRVQWVDEQQVLHPVIRAAAVAECMAELEAQLTPNQGDKV